MTRQRFADVLPRIAPPWLQRSIGGRFLGSIGVVMDAMVDRGRDGVALRFPLDTTDPDALALVGRERRIRRGPDEDATSYARRLRPWWDAHRARGGPYELLRQLRAYLLAVASIQCDVVAHSGTRHSISTTGVITRDSIVWGADGTALWAQVWVFLHLGAISPPGDLEVVRAIPRDWSAGHVKRLSIVLLTTTKRLWGYPSPCPVTWAQWGASGALWGDSATVTTVEA